MAAKDAEARPHENANAAPTPVGHREADGQEVKDKPRDAIPVREVRPTERAAKSEFHDGAQPRPTGNTSHPASATHIQPLQAPTQKPRTVHVARATQKPRAEIYERGISEYSKAREKGNRATEQVPKSHTRHERTRDTRKQHARRRESQSMGQGQPNASAAEFQSKRQPNSSAVEVPKTKPQVACHSEAMPRRPQQPKSKQTVKTKAKPTSIRITFRERKDQSEIQEFLCHDLGSVMDDIECSHFDDECCVVVLFPSIAKAKKAFHVLHNGNKEYHVEMSSDGRVSRASTEGQSQECIGKAAEKEYHVEMSSDGRVSPASTEGESQECIGKAAEKEYHVEMSSDGRVSRASTEGQSQECIGKAAEKEYHVEMSSDGRVSRASTEGQSQECIGKAAKKELHSDKKKHNVNKSDASALSCVTTDVESQGKATKKELQNEGKDHNVNISSDGTCMLSHVVTEDASQEHVGETKKEEAEHHVEMLSDLALRHLSGEIESLQRYIRSKQSIYLTQHDEEVASLTVSLPNQQSKKKYRSLEEHERRSEERKVLNLKLEERLQQRKEFDDYTNTQLQKLSELLSLKASDEQSVLNEITRIKANFSRECTHFAATLPIYARRSEIIKTILSHQVTVLVGETGSGKSTQVVQYLYDAGLADNGLIVCTQPRKVAAITLARHVCREMKIELGAELGYRVGMSTKCSGQTKVLYMTDHVLLNECISDHTLAKYSCVLIDEAHERSINTDMLLAFIKQCLPSRPNLKVVIMSATIEPKLFVRYFQESEQEQSSCRVSTISVSGRTFPVDVVYNPLQSKECLTPGSNYVTNAVEMAKRIHSNEPSGDILVFLTCAPEIERACKAIQHLNDTAVILPLHGKLPPEQQQEVFIEFKHKRKIIFSTNVAETSITIPGVKYVVDTGLAKEMQFDCRKNMDSLEVRMISKSSAEQRKGRAGRVSSGKCYRLYSSDEYTSNMPERTKPEILRIQLSQVILKLFEFGVPNVLTFDFVEHPDRDALEAAVETLKFIGALQDDALTDVGKKMAALPLNPQLAKVLLDGVDAGVGTEALCSVAISSLAGQVFFRGGTDEMKQESDKMKLPHCHPMGDQMTNLSVYQCWQEQERDNRNQWCIKQYVNGKSMRIVEETVKELGQILNQRLHIKLSLKLDSLEAADCYLGKLYFDAFLNNLAVYLGHERVGYMSTADTSSNFVVFPGSSLKQLSSTPKYVIYEKTLKTSRQFLTQVMCVKQEWVDEAIMSGRLPEDPAEKFKPYIYEPVDVIAIGPQTYQATARKQKEILENIEVGFPQCTISPFMDFSITPKQLGIVRVLAPEKCHNAMKQVMTQCVLEQQCKFKEEKKEFGISKERGDSTRLVIGAGGTVQRVIMPYQFRTLVAVCPNNGSWVKEIERRMENYGKVEKTRFKQCHKDFRLFITFSDPNTAQRAISECQYPDVTLRPWQSQQFTVKIEWERRERGAFAHLSFDSQQHCHRAYSSLRFGLRLHSAVKFALDRHSDSKLFLTGRSLQFLSEDVLRNEIAERISADIHFHLKMGRQRYDQSAEEQYLRMSRVHYDSLASSDEDEEQQYSDSSDDPESADESQHSNGEDEAVMEVTHRRYHEALKVELMAVIANYAKPGTYLLKFPDPKPYAFFFNVYLTFDNPDEGYKVLNSGLIREYIDGKPLTVTTNLKCELLFKREIFVLIREFLEQKRKYLLRDYDKVLRVKITPPNDTDLARVSIFADDVEAFTVAQIELNSAAQPHVIECQATELQEYILSRTCREQLEEIQASTSTYIYRDLGVMGIKIYGTKNNQMDAKGKVAEKAEELFSGGAKVVEVELGGSGRPPGLMKSLVSGYGRDLEGMLEMEGVRRISLNPRRQMISVLATREGLDAVEKCIEEYANKACQLTVRKLESVCEVNCSVCLTPVEEPKELFRLECCGHAFHTDCIAMQVKPDTLTFPVQCADKDCSKDLVLKDFENLQKQLNFRLKELVSASLKNHMEKNRDTYTNCPTPDCRMIYAIATDEGKPFTCSDCAVVTCTKCHKQYHTGISCEMYSAGQPKTDEEMLEEWIQEDPTNRKKCPKCSTPIEKNEGCKHITCTCGAHMCWLCLQTFKTAMECYYHQPDCPALPNTVPAPNPPLIPFVNNPARAIAPRAAPPRPTPPRAAVPRAAVPRAAVPRAAVPRAAVPRPAPPRAAANNAAINNRSQNNNSSCVIL